LVEPFDRWRYKPGEDEMGEMRSGRIRLVARVQGPARFAVGRLCRSVGLLAVLLVGVIALVPAGASAEPLCTNTWTGPSEGEWATEGDWSTGKVPTSASVACIGSGKTVKVTGGTNQTGVVQGKGTLMISGGSLEVANVLEASSIATVSMSGGTLTGAAEVDVTGSFTGSGGTITGSGTLVVESGATGSTVSGSSIALDRTLVNKGSFTIAKESGIGGEEAGKFDNNGTLTVNGEEKLYTGMFRIGFSGSAPVVNNTGTLQRTEGTGQITIEWAINNEGNVNVNAGKIIFNGGGISSTEHIGSWSAAGGSEVEFGGSTSFSIGSTVSLSGTIAIGSFLKVTSGTIEGSKANVLVNGGTLEVNGGTPSTIKTLNLESGHGDLAGSGEVDVSSSFVGGGTLLGPGALVIESGATAVTGTGLYLESKLVNKGSFTISPETGVGGSEKGIFTNDGTLAVNGTEKLYTGIYDYSYSEPPAKLINNGTLQRTEGTGQIPVEFTVENYGSIRPISGPFRFTHPVITKESETEYGSSENPSTPGEPHACSGDPVSCATGNLSETQTDLSIGGRGIGLNLTRTYNSQAGAEEIKGTFGYGWTSSFSDHLVVNKTSKVTTLHQANGSTVPFTEEGGGSFKAPMWTQDILSGTEGTGYTLTLANQIKYKFAGSSGRLESVTDRDGNATTLSYNEAGQLTTITDPVSRTIKLTYNGEGLVESAEDPMKHVVKYTYESGNLKSVTQPAAESLRWQFKYDGLHEITEMLDGREGKTVNEYNGSHQVIKQKDPAGHTLKFEYEPFQTKITNENTGSVTDEYFTSNDEPASITRGYGTESATTESFTYNEGGYITSVTDGNGHTTTYGYDAANDRTSMVDPNKNETKWTYDSTHDMETMTTPKGETTTIKRESHGNPEVIERPAPESKTQITKYKYTAHGELESVTNPLEHTWKYEYDAKGDRTAEIDPEGNKRTWEYNENSQETATVSPRGNVKEGEASKFTTKIERDAQGRPIKITDPLGHVTEYKYDRDGNIETVIDGNKRTTQYTYNGDNEPTKVETPNQAVTETEYDGAGQVVKQIDSNKHATEYKRNAVEEVKEVIDPLKHKTLKEYDAAGNLVKLTDPKGRTTTYTYDPANRLTEVSYSSGKPSTVKYEYDKDGDRTKMTDGTGTTTYTYDQLDRLTESENGHKEVIKYEYDLANDQTKIIYPNKKAVTRAFDKDGRLEKLTDWLSHSTKFTYNEDSDLKTIVFPSETKDEDKYVYNDADQMSEVKMDKSTEVLVSLAYTRDSDGQVKKITSKGLPGAEVTENTYDESNRLTKYGSTEYKYDKANDPIKEGSSTNTYNEGDELEKGTGTTYAYDELGERTKTTPEKGGATTYGYDQAGNLISVERPEKESVPKIEDTYAYNGNSLRASQTISGTTTYFAWDMTEELPLILSDGTNSYIYGPGGLPIEQISGAETPTYLHHDQQGSIRLLTGSAGTTTGSITFDAYGNKVESTGTISPLGYDGQYTSSDTGLIYLRARVYDPATAQFLSVDPIAAISRAPYNYTYDNPVNTIDPEGLFCISLSTSCAEEDAGEAVEVGSRIAATAIKYSPLGATIQTVSAVTGKTLGGCAGVGFVGGGSVHVSACYVASPNGQSAITYTGGGGAGFPIGAGGFFGATISNAQSPSELEGKFFTGGASGGDFVFSGGGSLAVGRDACGSSIWQVSGGWTPNVSFPVPASGYGGVSYTVAYESF
jgi:RHS repeat-associated protein